MKTLTITIDPLGRSKIEADGFNGQGCIAAARTVISALTIDETGISIEEKPELYVRCTEGQLEMEGL